MILHKLITYADAVLDRQIEELCAWTRKPKLNSLPTYADNATAIANKLVAGDIYRTVTGAVMVVY